jgi:hypothetical protein
MTVTSFTEGIGYLFAELKDPGLKASVRGSSGQTETGKKWTDY